MPHSSSRRSASAKPFDPHTCQGDWLGESDRGGSLRWLSFELLDEGDLVPREPEIDHLALCETKEIHLPHVNGPTGRHERSEVLTVEDAPMRTREVDVGRYDVAVGDEVVHVPLKSGKAVSQ